MNLASSREQTATEIIMDTQTELKELIKYATVNVDYMATFYDRAKKIIDNNVKLIKNEELRETARETLLKFVKNEYNQVILLLNLGQMPIVLAFADYNIKRVINTKELQRQITQKIRGLNLRDLNSAFSNLGNSQAKVSKSQSLFGHSELNARYQEQQEMVNNLRKETNLVICDTHSDCSDRCFKWQGRIYSLDGTYGTTEDGKEYIPLEVATNAMFKGHRNGLLGYNCRHVLRAYKKGMKAVTVTREEQQKQQALSAKQRMYEREIRHAKDMAMSFKKDVADMGVFDKKQREYLQGQYQYYKEKARFITEKYNKFCEDNNRVRYVSRLQI